MRKNSLMILTTLLAVLMSTNSSLAEPQEPPAQEEETNSETESEKEEGKSITLDEVIIKDIPKAPAKKGGSSHVIGEDLLETFEYDNPDAVLRQVPGVYIRSEDGFGLRPNIGLRGGNPERSKKVSLMEDGILFAPAPYSAPAAYYFPLLQRVTSIEVIKGPGAILYGPNTIGGAINLVTRAIPEYSEGLVDLSYGLYNSSKLHSHYGTATDNAGFLVEGIWLRSSGFKELDGGGDTGFNKGEVMVKAMVRNGRTPKVQHRGDLKITGAIEQSNETYLGVTDADFEDNPFRRYKASQLDQMNAYRYAGVLGYKLQTEQHRLDARVYHSAFQRAWDKVSKIGTSGSTLADIIASPDTPGHAPFYDVLKGEADSSGASDAIIMGRNARSYWVQGGDVQGVVKGDMGPVKHAIRVGTRVHHDRIIRDHTTKAYDMIDGKLEDRGIERQVAADTEANSLAIASFLSWELEAWGLSIVPGVRHEWISQTFVNNPTGDETDSTTQVLLLGAGTHYAITDEFGILAGVHQGFSPTAPGQDDAVQSERSVNYEGGFRYEKEATGTAAEAIGFLNQYSNMVAQCSFSVGCSVEDLDKEYNAGEVLVYGVESLVSHRFDIPNGMFLPVRATYTWTDSSFQTSFLSGNPQLGDVEAGDQLPYLPTHQISGHLGVAGLSWGLDIGLLYISEMREEAGSGDDGELTDPIFHLDAAARYLPADWVEVYLKGENLTAETPIAARRPYGARPGKPLLVMGGAKFFF